MIARGSARCGSLTSSPAVETASRPMKEKKIVPAAALMPADPDAQKLSKRSAWNAVSPITMNITSTPSLMSTMTVLTRADSLAPRISSSVHIATRTIAGRLTRPLVPSYGMGE